jgi:pyridoxal phosphate enzyme (YggS family)
MAVSKQHPAEAILEAASAGLRLFGENRVQEWSQKSPLLAHATPAHPIEVHLIGHLQSNKAAKAAEIFSSIDTIDSIRLAERLNEAAQKLDRILPILIEIKLSPEEAKTGAAPADLPELLERVSSLPNLKLRGLMTVPPWSEDPEQARPFFAELRRLRDRMAAEHPSLDLSQLSMGMSGDFALAIGTAIFGKRQASALR